MISSETCGQIKTSTPSEKTTAR